MKRHLLIHSGEKKYICIPWDKPFGQIHAHSQWEGNHICEKMPKIIQFSRTFEYAQVQYSQARHLSARSYCTNCKIDKLDETFKTPKPSKCNCVTLNRLGPKLWFYIWKCTQEKQIKCNHCGNLVCFYTVQELWGHIWKHTIEKSPTNSTCVTLHLLVPEGDLRNHLRTHPGEKPNKCSQCKYTSSRTDKLRTPFKIHCGERAKKCNQCDFESSLKQGLNDIWKQIQIQLVWIYIPPAIPHEDTSENTQWRQM